MKKEKRKDMANDKEKIHRFTVDLDDDTWEALKIKSSKRAGYHAGNHHSPYQGLFEKGVNYAQAICQSKRCV